jgi:hypothetical protein
LEATLRQKNGRIDEVWQVWNKKSTAGWDATHTKNIRAIGLKKTAQKNNGKYEQPVTCSKSSVVVALCLLPAEKTNVERNCSFLNQIASEKVL